MLNQQFFTKQAWVNGAWENNVLFTVSKDGLWENIVLNVELKQTTSATQLSGPVIPALVDAHSHAFQRAIVGLTERKSSNSNGASDDFWSWRDRMYSAALRISPEQIEHIATMLYSELLAAGYSQVCEFHYLHNQIDGAHFSNPLEMSLALVRAAQTVGIGLTMLPTLYMRSGFGAAGLRDDQCRFKSTPASIISFIEGLQQHTKGMPNINVGVAIHSLRAADKEAVQEIAAYAKKTALPVHIHIAEQTQEIDDCVSHTGQRPIEWLNQNVVLDDNWNLVHATHTTLNELQAIRDTGASIVICPTTEGNLGDGVFDFPNYSEIGGKWSIGSDSHVTRSWTEELRLLEYSQRLTLRKRNVAPKHSNHLSTAAALFEGALMGGKSATAKNLGGIQIGNRADFIILDTSCSSLIGLPTEYLLDSLIFSSPSKAFSEVYVAGKLVTASDSKIQSIKQNFELTMKSLWQ